MVVFMLMGYWANSQEGPATEEKEVFVVVEVPARPKSFANFKKYLSKSFKCPELKDKVEVTIQFTTDPKGYLQDVIIIENSLAVSCEKALTELLMNAPPWTPAQQRDKLVWQKHRIRLLLQGAIIDDALLLPPKLSNGDLLSIYLMRNIDVSKRINNDPAVFEIYALFEHNRAMRKLRGIQILNCNDKLMEGEILRLLNQMPYNLVFDLYPENKKLIQPIILFINKPTVPTSKIDLPEGELQKEVIISMNQ